MLRNECLNVTKGRPSAIIKRMLQNMTNFHLLKKILKVHANVRSLKEGSAI